MINYIKKRKRLNRLMNGDETVQTCTPISDDVYNKNKAKRYNTGMVDQILEGLIGSANSA